MYHNYCIKFFSSILLAAFYCFVSSTNCVGVEKEQVVLNTCFSAESNVGLQPTTQLVIIPAELTIEGKASLLFSTNALSPHTQLCGSQYKRKIPIHFLQHSDPDPLLLQTEIKESQSEIINGNSFVATSSGPDLNNAEFSSFEKLPKTPLFNPNGYIYFEGEAYHPSKYCVELSRREHLDERIVSITICHPECGQTDICVNKCCPPNQVIDMKLYGCASSGEILWTPQIHTTNQSILSLPLHFNIQLPRDCSSVSSSAHLVSRYNRDIKKLDGNGIQGKSTFRILPKEPGILILKEGTNTWQDIRRGPFCTDGMQNFIDGQQQGQLFSGRDEDSILILCEEEFIPEKTDYVSEIVYTILILISAGFLLITSIVQFLIMETQTAHGWTILFSMLSMFFTYLGLGLSHGVPLVFSGQHDVYLDSIPCVFLGATTHYFLLSTFFWLTVFDYDIWKTFRSIDGLSHKLVSRKKFCGTYLVGGFGLPELIVGSGFWIDYTHKRNAEHGLSPYLIPKYGQDNCYISADALGLYVYSIIGILMVFNLFFICLTAKNIQAVRSGGRNLQSNSKRQSAWKLFGKLFLIMGVTWVLEVISWIHSQISSSTKPWYWTISDIINIMQPIAIFVIVVCKRQSARQLESKMNSVKSMITSIPSFSRRSTTFSGESSTKRGTSSRKVSNITSTITLNEVRSTPVAANANINANV